MTEKRLATWLVLFVLAAVFNKSVLALPVARQEEAKKLPTVHFIQPATEPDKDQGEKPEHPAYQPVVDTRQLEDLKKKLTHGSVTLALTLFELAQRTAGTDYPYFIALVDGGNNASQGFRLVMPDGKIRTHEKVPLILLDPKAKDFQTTLLHETGHMIFSLLSDGRGIPTEPIAPMFHTTAAITDRGTAFNEGFAEHLEAVWAHFADDRRSSDYYGHRSLTASSGSMVRQGFLFPIDDMSNYAQSFARYQSVRDNQYSFENATNVADYYRVQLSPGPDYERPRNASQLVASEGFVSTFFFWLVAQQVDSLSREQLNKVYLPIFEGLQRTLAPATDDDPPVPAYLTRFAKRFGEHDPELRRLAFRLLYHLSRGAFFQQDFAERWQAILEAHYRLDIHAIRALHDALETEEKKAVDRCLEDPDLIDQFVGNVIAVQANNATVRLPVAFGDQELPLTFDVNTVPSRILSLIDGITPEEITTFTNNRKTPWRDFADFQKRSGLQAAVLKQIQPVEIGQ